MENQKPLLKPKIAILLLNWNGKKDTLECLASLEKLTSSNHEIIVIDNASVDDSVAVIQKAYPAITVLCNSSNLGYAGGNNVGIEYALKQGADYICVLNNDTVVHPDFLQEFLLAFQKEPNAGILGAKICRYDRKDEIDHIGGYWQKDKGEFVSIGTGEPKEKYQDMQPVDYVTGCAMFIKKEVLEKIGSFEKQFFLFWEESDLCFRAKKAGFGVWTAPRALVWHKISSSFEGNKPHRYYYFWRNRLLWMERNLDKKEKREVYLKVVLPEAWHVFKLFQIKGLQFHLTKLFSSQASAKREEKYLYYKAGVQGICDFFLKRFGMGPFWLIKKHSSQSGLHAIRKMRE